MTAFVEVKPLAPPFSGTVFFMSFEKYDKELALSPEDHAKVTDLLGSNPVDRVVELSGADDGVHVRIAVIPS
jgi:hypothetical protein